jgi:hypothetical protein
VTSVRRIVVILGCAAAVVACGSSSHTTTLNHPDPPLWSGLTHVSVDVDQPSVAPIPGVKHTPTTFTTPAQLATVTAALNANQIRKAARTTTNDGCTGGIEIAIKITQHQHRKTKLNAYQCAKTITGDIAGNLTGFLKQIGVSIP